MYIDGFIYVVFMMSGMIVLLFISQGAYYLYETFVARRYGNLDIAKLLIKLINAVDRLILYFMEAYSRSQKRRSPLDVDIYIVRMLRNN